jgi:hypothetical protein
MLFYVPAYKLKESLTIEFKLPLFIKRAEEECRKAIEDLYIRTLLSPTLRGLVFESAPEGIPDEIACSNFYLRKLEEIEKANQPHEYDLRHDLRVSIKYWIIAGEFFIKPQCGCGASGCLNFMAEDPDLVDWSYALNTKPKNVTQEEWAERRKTWEKIEAGGDAVVGPITVHILDSSNFSKMDPAQVT